MKKHKKTILALVVFTAFIAVALFLPVMVIAGSLEPSAAPAPTMKTLDQIPPTWSQKIAGSERFELVLDGEGVLDKETGLVWEKSPSTGPYTWANAILHCVTLNVGGRMGWHLPTIEQLASLVDRSVGGLLQLPTGHPFLYVQSGSYWSATTYFDFPTTYAWAVGFYFGYVGYGAKTGSNYAWCVRGGQSHDAY